MTEKLVIRQNTLEMYKVVGKAAKECTEEATKIWLGVIRLLITLSSSFLILSVALVDKIFPIDKAPQHIQSTLIAGWVLFFMVIVFGIIAELDAAKFFQKLAKRYEIKLSEILKDLSRGELERAEYVDEEQKFIVDMDLLWGILEIWSFLLAIACSVLYFAGNIFKISLLLEGLIFLLLIIFVGTITYSLLRKK